MQETQVRFLGQEDPLEKEMATHSSTLAWKIPWTEEPGRLQSMGSQRVRHDWATSLPRNFSLSFCTFQPSQIKFSCLPVSRVECMLKLPSLDLVFSSNRGELETLGAAYPAETLSPGGSAPPSGTKTSSSKTGVPGVETFFYSISIKSQVLF